MLKPEPSKWEVPEVQKPDPDIKKIPAAGEIQGSPFDAGKKTDLPGQNMLFSDPIDPDNSKTAEAQAAKVGLEAKFDSMKSHNDEVHRLAAEKGLHREAIAGWPSELGDGYDNGQSPAETLATIEKAMADEAKEIAEARASKGTSKNTHDDFIAKAKKAIDDKLSSSGNVGNVWSSVKDATGKGIGDMSPEERRVLKDHAEGRRAIEKPEPSGARAKAMAAQKEKQAADNKAFDDWVAASEKKESAEQTGPKTGHFTDPTPTKE